MHVKPHGALYNVAVRNADVCRAIGEGVQKLPHAPEMLRKRLGLDRSQKAELLREVAGLAAWVVRQAEQGREIDATATRFYERHGLIRLSDEYPCRMVLDLGPILQP